MDRIGICFGVSKGRLIDPVFCEKNRNGMWSCWSARSFEDIGGKEVDTSNTRVVSPAGETCDFFLYEFDGFVLLRYPRQLICDETAFSEIERLFGRDEAEYAKQEYDKIKQYESMRDVGLHGAGWMLFAGKRFFAIVVNKKTPAWDSPVLQEELEKARENYKDVP